MASSKRSPAESTKHTSDTATNSPRQRPTKRRAESLIDPPEKSHDGGDLQKPLFEVDYKRRVPATWNQKATAKQPADWVNVYVEADDNPRGILVYAYLPRTKLLSRLPSLQQYIRDETSNETKSDVLLPGISDDYLKTVIDAVLAKFPTDPSIHVTIDYSFLAFVQHHDIFGLLGLQAEQKQVEDRIWSYLNETELTIQEVTYVWGNHGQSQFVTAKWPQGPYVAPDSDFYVQAMAYQILNLKKLGRLGYYVNEYVYGDKASSQPRLKEVIEQREKKFGIHTGYDTAKNSKPAASTQLWMKTFASLKLSSEWKEDALPNSPVPSAKAYLDANLWKGVDPRETVPLKWDDKSMSSTETDIQEPARIPKNVVPAKTLPAILQPKEHGIFTGFDYARASAHIVNDKGDGYDRQMGGSSHTPHTSKSITSAQPTTSSVLAKENEAPLSGDHNNPSSKAPPSTRTFGDTKVSGDKKQGGPNSAAVMDYQNNTMDIDVPTYSTAAAKPSAGFGFGQPHPGISQMGKNLSAATQPTTTLGGKAANPFGSGDSNEIPSLPFSRPANSFNTSTSSKPKHTGLFGLFGSTTPLSNPLNNNFRGQTYQPGVAPNIFGGPTSQQPSATVFSGQSAHAASSNNIHGGQKRHPNSSNMSGNGDRAHSTTPNMLAGAQPADLAPSSNTFSGNQPPQSTNVFGSSNTQKPERSGFDFGAMNDNGTIPFAFNANQGERNDGIGGMKGGGGTTAQNLRKIARPKGRLPRGRR